MSTSDLSLKLGSEETRGFSADFCEEEIHATKNSMNKLLSLQKGKTSNC